MILPAVTVRALKLLGGAVAAVGLATFPAGAAARRAHVGGRAAVFRGATSQARRLSFRVTRRRRVRGLIGRFSYTCTLGSVEVTRSGRAAIRSSLAIRHGAFHYHGPVLVRSSGATIGHGRVRIDGHFRGRRRAAGSAVLTLHLADGWSCHSGTVTFTARARR